MKKSFMGGCSLIAMTVSMMTASQAIAQDAVEADEAEDVIIVTSTRRETALLETPISVTAVDQAALDRLNISNIATLNRVVPGLQIRDNSTDGQGSVDINLRGVGNSNFIETSESNVSFNIDGVYTARPQAALQLFNDVERVEVARGPQGTLSGRNATIGSINVITRRPDAEVWEGSGELEYGKFNARGIKAMLNVPLVEGIFAIRANVARYKRNSHSNLIDDEEMNNAIEQLSGGGLSDGDDVTTVDALPIWETGQFDPFVANRPGGYWDPYFATNYGNGGDTGVGSFGSEDKMAFRGSALFTPTDDFSLYFTYENFRNKALGNPLSVDCDRADCEADYTPNQVAQSGPFTSFVSFKGMADQEIENYRAVAEYNFNDVIDVKYTYGRSNFRNEIVQDLDFGVAVELAFADGGLLTDPWTSLSQSHDFQLTSTHEGPLQWTAGLFDFSEHNDRQLMVSYFHWGQVAFPNHNYKVDTTAAYADFTYDISEQMQIFGGLRYTEDKKSNSGAAEYRLISSDCAAEIAAHPDSLSPGNNFATAGAAALVGSPACLVGSTEASPSKDEFADFRVGVNYDISDDHMVYASVSSGHKAALQDQIYNIGRYSPQQVIVPVPTESLISYEVGTKGKSGDITFAVAAFFMDYKNKQEAQFYNFGDLQCDLNGNGVMDGGAEAELGCGIGFDASTDPLLTPDLDDSEFADNIQFAIVPAKKVEVYGVEVEAAAMIGDNGYLSGFATYTRSKYKDFEYSHVLGCPNGALNWCDTHNVAGNTTRNTPELTMSATYTHTFDLGSNVILQPTLNMQYRSKYYLSPENVKPGQVSAPEIGVDTNTFYDGTFANNNESALYSDEQGSTLKLNFNIALQINEMYTLEIFGTNITNQKVRSHMRMDTANTPLFAYEDPREYGARIKAKF